MPKMRKKKKPKKPFWQKYGPEIKEISASTRKIIEEGHAIDYLLGAACAGLGTYGGLVFTEEDQLLHGMTGGLLGLLGYKLATSGQLAGSAAGISLLTGLGILPYIPAPTAETEKKMKMIPTGAYLFLLLGPMGLATLPYIGGTPWLES